MAATSSVADTGGTTLLLVDVQRDFHPGGSLAIPTAHEDADRIADDLIRTHGSKINRIVATLDSHHKLHIAHPFFWMAGDDASKQPTPFTIISAEDIEQGKWKPRPNLRMSLDELFDPSVFEKKESVMTDGVFDLNKYCLEYARRLEAKGRFQICIWPEHCLIGSVGHSVVPNVRKAIDEWSVQTGGSVEWVFKGENLLTEMYSALAADVPVSTATSFNDSLHRSLMKSERLLVCGQAMSHCVNYTARDIVDNCKKEEASKIILLTDCASAVPGFEAAAETFQNDMKAAGVQLLTVAGLEEIL
jgi:nicotinamidase/pyrazinamidase